MSSQASGTKLDFLVKAVFMLTLCSVALLCWSWREFFVVIRLWRQLGVSLFIAVMIFAIAYRVAKGRKTVDWSEWGCLVNTLSLIVFPVLANILWFLWPAPIPGNWAGSIRNSDPRFHDATAVIKFSADGTFRFHERRPAFSEAVEVDATGLWRSNGREIELEYEGGNRMALQRHGNFLARQSTGEDGASASMWLRKDRLPLFNDPDDFEPNNVN